METGKRIRSNNFTLQEKELLFSLVESKKALIENKKTDALTCKDKEMAWSDITMKFNAEAPSFTPRTMESLRKFYANSKRDVRKAVGDEKKQVYLTGGGPPPKPISKGSEILLDIVNKKTIYGLNNPFDSDVVTPVDMIGVRKQGSNVILENKTVTRNDSQIEFVFEENTEENTQSSNVNEVLDEAQDEPNIKNNKWNTYKPGDLQQELHPSLKRKLQGDHVVTNKMSRRRPQTGRIFTSSVLAERYEELVNKKIELADAAKKEHELRMVLLNQEIELRKKKLENDLNP